MDLVNSWDTNHRERDLHRVVSQHMDHRPRAFALSPRRPRRKPPIEPAVDRLAALLRSRDRSAVRILRRAVEPRGDQAPQELAPCRALFTVRRRSHVGALPEGPALRSSKLSEPARAAVPAFSERALRWRVLRDCRAFGDCRATASASRYRFHDPELPPLFSQSMS